MKPKYIFCIAVSIAIVIVILLALISPVAHKKSRKSQTRPWLALSLYMQEPQSETPYKKHTPSNSKTALVFQHMLTEGPKNTSRVIGKAQGFIIPIEEFAHSAFNIIYLTFTLPEYSGSLSLHANHVENNGRDGYTVVGGTGRFAFARGMAVFADSDQQQSFLDAIYHVKLRLKLPR
ncbi:hypothetical protein ACHQM5_014136 [Ranunculus cassubicifolius]